MRVDAAPSTPAQSSVSAGSATQGDAALSFEQLLEEGVTLEVQRQQRAFGFSELGVLRPCSADTAQQTLTTAERVVDGLPADAETPMRAGVADFPEIALPQTGPSQPGTNSKSSVEQAFLTPGGGRLQATASESRQTIVAPQRTPMSRLARQSQPSAPKAPSRQLPQATPARRFSLVMSEQDGAVQIIAGAPQLSPEAKERLRKAAAMLAAEFGVTLSEFTINGAFVDAPAPITGASDGDFAG